MRWATDAEFRLRAILHPDDASQFFSRPGHRDVCTMPLGNHLMPLLNNELDILRRDLTTTTAYLKRHPDRMRATGGLPILLDTMVLLQCQRLDQVKWLPAIGEHARVMVPLRVIEELEDKKVQRQ